MSLNRKYSIGASAIFMFIALVSYLSTNNRIKWPTETYTLMHTIDNQCPPNTKLLKGVFKQKDGSTKDGCYRSGPTNYSIDVLYPGESVNINVMTGVPEYESN